MAYKFVDGWENYATSDLLRMWTQAYGGIVAGKYFVTPGAGRRSGNAFVKRGDGNFQGLARTVVPGTTTALVGTAFKGSGGTGGGWGVLITPAAGGNSINLVAANAGGLDVRVNEILAVRYDYYTHLAVSVNTNGTLSVYRGNADSKVGALAGQDRIAATFGPTPQALQYEQFYYIELQAVIHPTSGSFDLRVNGETWLSAAGVRTQADGASSVTAWQELVIGVNLSSISDNDFIYDDLYLGDTSLADAYNQLAALTGDIAVNYANVFDDGTTIQWTRLSGAENFEMVDDNPPDLDTTYNHTNTIGNIDTFLKNVVPVVGQAVLAVIPIYLVRRVEGGNTATAAVLRDAGANYSGSKAGTGTTYPNTTSYTYDWWAVTQRPSNSAVTLTQALVDAMEAGYLKGS